MSTQSCPLGWTTLEQSKALIEAGLNPETADMNHYKKIDGWVTLPKGEINYGGFEMVPCWSTGALIELLPKYIKSGKEYFDLMIVPFYNQVKYYNEKEKTYLESRMEITLLDSLVSMIERLLRCKSTYSDVSSKCLLFS